MTHFIRPVQSVAYIVDGNTKQDTNDDFVSPNIFTDFVVIQIFQDRRYEIDVNTLICIISNVIFNYR